MTPLSDTTKTEFYKFLNGDIAISTLENFIYKNSELEHHLNKDIYLELISFEFQEKYAVNRLSEFIKEKIIDEGEFETWRLKDILKAFLRDPNNLNIYLDKLYHCYCGIYQDNTKRKYEFKFLANLGLNYLYWVDKGYMKLNYGKNWRQEYERSFLDFEFYHKQLKPFAEDILYALNNRQIVIRNDGTYLINDELKQTFETDKIYQLKHPDKRYSS